jgi:hypothetical protein
MDIILIFHLGLQKFPFPASNWIIINTGGVSLIPKLLGPEVILDIFEILE